MKNILVEKTFEFLPGEMAQYAALDVESFMSDTQLTNAEIVIYGYLLVSYYNPEEGRIKFTDSVRVLAALVNISRKTTAEALDGLVDKKMLKKVKAGYLDANPGKKKYIAVPKEFLLTTKLTTSQKAFLLRLAALKKAGVVKETKITQKELAENMKVSTSHISHTLVKLLDDIPTWINVYEGMIVINYHKITRMAVNEFIEYYEQSIKDVVRLPTRLQLEFKVNTSVTKKPSEAKMELINQYDLLRHEADPVQLMKAKRYIMQSRLTLARKILNKETQRLNNEE